MNRGVLLAWGASLFIYGLAVALLYDSVKDITGFAEYLDAMPEQLMGAVGIRDEADIAAMLPEGFFSLEGFIGVEFLAMWPILLAIYAVFAAGGIVSGEAEKGTLDLILSQPVRRHQVLITKFFLFLVGLLALAAASFVGIMLGLALIGQSVEPMGIALALFQGWLLVVGVAGYSALFSCLFLDPRRVRIGAGLLTAALYIVSFIGPSLGSLQWMEQLSLFYYYNATGIMSSGTLDGVGAAYSFGLALASMIAAITVFQRRDIAG
jgi:ABC-2 type transport system permease protein